MYLSYSTSATSSVATDAERRAKWEQALGPKYQVLVRSHCVPHFHSHCPSWMLKCVRVLSGGEVGSFH